MASPRSPFTAAAVAAALLGGPAVGTRAAAEASPRRQVPAPRPPRPRASARPPAPPPVAVPGAASPRAPIDGADRADPPFLGIAYRPGAFGLLVLEVSEGAGAAVAGVQPGDEIISFGGDPTPADAPIAPLVTRRRPGERVPVVVLRDGAPVRLTVEVSTRWEVLHRRLVGQPAPGTGLVGVDDGRAYDLAEVRGRVAVVGWFTPRCDGCAALFGPVAAWGRAAATDGGAPLLLAATLGEVPSGGPGAPAASPPRPPPLTSTVAAPLAVADREVFAQYAIVDDERATFVVIDPAGVVRYVCQVRPGEGAEAALDEVVAAAEQASHRPGAPRGRR